MNMISRVSAALVAAGVLMGASTVSATPGAHWSPTFGPGSATWMDHHGRTLAFAIDFLNSTYTQQLSGPNTTHRAAAVCALNGTPITIVYGPIVYASATSGAACGILDNPFGAGATSP